jgi:hypothetical protein
MNRLPYTKHSRSQASRLNSRHKYLKRSKPLPWLIEIEAEVMISQINFLLREELHAACMTYTFNTSTRLSQNQMCVCTVPQARATKLQRQSAQGCHASHVELNFIRMFFSGTLLIRRRLTSVEKSQGDQTAHRKTPCQS